MKELAAVTLMWIISAPCFAATTPQAKKHAATQHILWRGDRQSPDLRNSECMGEVAQLDRDP